MENLYEIKYNQNINNSQRTPWDGTGHPWDDDPPNDLVLKFDGELPEDFIIAPGPGLEYKYYVTQPNGEPFYDVFTGLMVEELRARSEYIEGEYRWIYEAHWGDFIPEESIVPNPVINEHRDNIAKLRGQWSTPYAMYYYPNEYVSRWKVDLFAAKRNLETGDLKLGFKVRTNQTPYAHVYDPWNDIWIDGYYCSRTQRDDQLLYLYANDTLLNNDYFSVSDIYDEDQITNANFDRHAPYGIVEDRKFLEEHEVYLNLPAELSQGKIDFTFYSNADVQNNYYELNTPEVGDKLTYEGEMDLLNHYTLDTTQPDYFSFSFVDGMEESVSIPYYYMNGKAVKSEEFIATKLFSNQYQYPTTTTDLVKFEYKNAGVPNTPYINESSITAKVNINNFESKEIKVKNRIEGNSVIFYVDEPMYYDQNKHEVYIGKSHIYLNEEGIVLPWDGESKGTIEFNMTASESKEYEFNFKLGIGASHPLRGENGRYEIKEIK